MDVFYFPFDIQTCKIHFSSWTYTVASLNYSIINNNDVLSDYEESNTWEVIDVKYNREDVIYENWGELDPFSEMHYTLKLKRKPLYLIMNCVVPAIILSLLTLVSFFLPFAQQNQIGISIILSFSVLSIK